MGAMWVATEIRAGSAYAHSALAIVVCEEEQARQKGSSGG